MSKNLLQDMIKVKRVSREAQALQEEFRPERVKPGREKPKGPRYTLWFVVIVSLIFFIFAISYLFLKITVTINPRMQDAVLNENLSASKNGEAETLPFDLIVISGEENKVVQTTEKKDVLEKAQGVVLIYNNFSSASQRLDIDTRLEGSNGKIYKTKKQIVAPGMKGKTPGSVEVGVYAVEGGEEYNSGPLDFTILGFKGTPKYSKFYARSKNEITGGFKGKSSFISENQKTSVIDEMRTALQAKLFKKATGQIPNGFILFKNAAFLEIDDSDFGLTSSKDEMLPVKLKGTLYGFLFDETKLVKKLAESDIDGYDGSLVYLPNIKDLTFSLLNTNLSDGQEKGDSSAKNNISFGEVKNINFNLAGATKIVWKLDENKLKTDLLGKSKEDFNQILLKYPNVNSADLVISPFWKMSFPDKVKDIKVIVNYPK